MMEFRILAGSPAEFHFLHRFEDDRHLFVSLMCEYSNYVIRYISQFGNMTSQFDFYPAQDVDLFVYHAQTLRVLFTFKLVQTVEYGLLSGALQHDIFSAEASASRVGLVRFLYTVMFTFLVCSDIAWVFF